MRLRPAVHYAPLDNGVYFSGARTRFAWQGSPALFRIADVCVPLLEDGADEEELVAVLGPRSRPVVRSLVASLDEHGLLLHLDRLTGPEPNADERAAHAGILAYLEARSDDPYADFARLRSARVLLCGACDAVLPAARGLHRAGVRRLHLAVPDVADRIARRTAQRLGAELHDITRYVGPAADCDALLYVVDAADGDLGAEERLLAEARAALPVGRPLVPVLLGGAVAQIGPVSHRPEPLALRRRALDWAGARGQVPLVRPAGDALAGALAAELLLHTLTVPGPGPRALVVHSPELTATPVPEAAPAVCTTTPPVDLAVALSTAAAELLTDPTARAALVEPLVQPFTGPLVSETPYDLPQLPLSLAQAQLVDAPAGPPVVAWGDDQASANLHAIMEALLATGPGASGAGVTGAAGLDELRGMLDGALRLLVPYVRPVATLEPAALTQRANSLWRTLTDYELVRCEVVTQSVPGVDWVLARVNELRDGVEPRELAAAWGPDAGQAVTDALAGALAAVQVRAVRGTPPSTARPTAYALTSVDTVTVDKLHQQLLDWTAARSLHLTGRRAADDPLLGALPLWHGTVSLRGGDEAGRD
ncbi:hypothetical protein [Streptomyces sp. NPDC058294]|uniref:hypothetical protein n=1 Tax=Streptomyces sp. NPDC058294 TaxID=3346430 RepID=UPI0036E28A6F